MKTSTLAILCGVAALALGALIAISLAVAHQRGSSPKATFDGALMPPGTRAPDFALRDQNGRLVRMSSFRGRPVIVTFLYAKCKDSCPAQAQQIKGAMDDLGHDLPAIAISADPTTDTPRLARHFLTVQGMSTRLRFLLGTKRELEPVYKGFAVAPQRPGHEHQSWLTLVDKRGIQRVGYPGAQVTPERLAHDLRLLEKQ